MRTSLAAFRNDEAGVVIIGTILWIPFMFLMTLAMAEVYLLQTHRAIAMWVLEGETRAFATGGSKSCTEMVDKVQNRLRPIMPSATASCTIAGTMVETSLEIASNDLGRGAMGSLVGDFTMKSSSLQTFEYVHGF